MSDSSLSSAGPTKATLEQALRHAVQRIYQNGNLEDLTVKRLRTAAEQDLDLEDGFYKNDPKWKEESKSIIQSEVEAHNANSAGEPSTSQVSPKPEPPSKQPKLGELKLQKKGVKRVPQEELGSRKRRKKVEPSNKAAADESHDVQANSPIAKTKKYNSKAISPTPDENPEENLEDEDERKGEIDSAPQDSPINETIAPGSDSEMSVLIDEKPRRKSKGHNSAPRKPSNKKPANSRMAKGVEQSADPDAEEIKRLQGWLIKCGIRKMWYKELAPYGTPKLKIHHLKEMLSEAGMTGRYSIEKAAQIRDERELKADLEAVQEGDKHWGKVESEEEQASKPRRRLARGLKELDFLNDDDGAETD